HGTGPPSCRCRPPFRTQASAARATVVRGKGLLATANAPRLPTACAHSTAPRDAGPTGGRRCRHGAQDPVAIQPLGRTLFLGSTISRLLVDVASERLAAVFRPSAGSLLSRHRGPVGRSCARSLWSAATSVRG